ncbi:MAG: amidohydrolase [Gemmatimonadetes bacterium]|jgi:predicted TIM-barrel fold metal-dependent hydrolase|nr:amidohydrolase [Gemmatimonadota bacterium]MBT7863601.1 amidohydrolase [Gemmatimonadota bacterium]
MGYIDAHVHVWTDDYETYPFAAGHDPDDAKPRTFHAADILGHANPCGVDRVVLVQMSYYGTDNRYMLKTMADHPGVFGGIGVVDVKGAAPEREMRELASKGVYGFRVAPRDQPLPTWCDGDGYARMFEAGAEDRLAICPLVTPEGLPALARRCEQFPDTPILIDHLCLVGGRGPVQTDHVEALCDMARFEQVMVKVSAFYALGDKTEPYHDLRDLIGRVVDAFGPQRLMWASDAPYQVQPPFTYAASVGLIAEGLDSLSQDDREQILGGTAREFFFRSS